MCVSVKTPKISSMQVPDPAPTLPPLQAPVESTASDPATGALEDDKKRRIAAAFGRSKTILTGSEGDLSAYKTDKKSLLGL